MALKFETFEFANVSSIHITKTDRELLTRRGAVTAAENEKLADTNIYLVAHRANTDWFVGIGDEFNRADRVRLTQAGFSRQFTKIIADLVATRVYYVRFDSCGYQVEGADRFE